MAKFIGVAGFLLIIASALTFIGAARPALLWEAAKIQNLIGRLGETGARVFFFSLAALNIAAAIFVLIKARTAA